MSQASKPGRGGSQTPADQQVAKATALSEMLPEEMPGSVFDSEALKSLSSFDDAMKIVAQAYGRPIEDATEELGDGFTLLDGNNKEILCGLPLIVMEWQFHAGGFGNKYVSVRVAARHQNGSMGKYIFNDSSAPGCAEQLAKYTKDTGKYGGIMIPNGLRKSTYEYDDNGVKKTGTSWWIDLSKKL
jgi:hypothetical protein